MEAPAAEPEVPGIRGAADTTEDWGDVQRFLAGDADAFVSLFTRNRGLMVSLLSRYRGTMFTAEDIDEILSDTFVRAHRGLARFRGDSLFRTWLTRIAINLMKNRIEFNKRRKIDVTVSMDAPVSENPDHQARTLADYLPDHDARAANDDAELGELASDAETALGKLSEGHRKILTLRNVEHKDYETIATELGISVGTVKSRIARARQCLRAVMGVEQ